MLCEIYYNKPLRSASAFLASALSITLNIIRTWLNIDHPNKHFVAVTLIRTTKSEANQNITSLTEIVRLCKRLSLSC